MTLSPLLGAFPPIPSHAIAALLAFLLGSVQMLSRKGGARHRWVGRIWVALLAYVAGSSFFISELQVWGRWSPIHLLSIFTLLSLAAGVWFARTGNIKGHRITMTLLYFLALALTGGFTLFPGRVMHAVYFGG